MAPGESGDIEEGGFEDGVGLRNATPLLRHAVDIGMTRMGEMYRTEDMATLISGLPQGLSTRLIKNWDLEILLEALSGGSIAIVPYDRSPSNDRPILKEGINAHWAIVRGYAVPLSRSQKVPGCEPYEERDETVFSGLGGPDTKEDMAVPIAADEVVLICMQGMTMRQMMCPFRHMFESNRQLHCKKEDCKELDGEATLRNSILIIGPAN